MFAVPGGVRALDPAEVLSSAFPDGDVINQSAAAAICLDKSVPFPIVMMEVER
jgi:hypothetical protein